MPGIVMSLYALLQNSYDPVTRRYVLSEMVELEGALDGNLCRCTGYKPTLDAAKSFVQEDLGGVVFEGKKSKVEGNWVGITSPERRALELAVADAPAGAEKLKHTYPSTKIVAGNSEVQVEVKFKHEKSQGILYRRGEGEVVIGGNTSLTVLEKACLEGYKKLGKRGFVIEAIRKRLRYFAGRQIRNTATPAGNIVTASPISDLNPVLIASSTVLTAQSKTRGEFPLPMKEFFVAYWTTALPADSIITKLTIPLPAEGTRGVIKPYKQTKRKDDGIAIVTAGFRDFPLGFTVPDGMPTYRKTPAFLFLFRFWHEVAAELELGTQEQQVDHEVIEEIHRGISNGSRDNDNPYEQRAVRKEILPLSGLKQATGEAEYIDDMPNIEGSSSEVLCCRRRLTISLSQSISPLHYKHPKDKPLFAKVFVHSYGQPIGMVYAESAAISQAAAQLVDVQYEELPPIFTISEVIAAKSFFPHRKMLIRGKPTAEAFKNCDFAYEGVARMGGHEHSCLKIDAAAVIPRPEDGEMEVWPGTQNIMDTRVCLASYWCS
ncbi:hypothetical protein L873DRAFT_1791827 [Choiromyces venosus 120613-1]|uniref:FAD-binding PCMH-type domain-containing protein n=1 Tax=Choiromyces venosus 120613-1 TaxID=1336337 RepID=A0A3N4JCS8_9PEZI|nr:hypothetical protein L873DRAFT_1791827 [Choiromyces venosus 120613-1]